MNKRKRLLKAILLLLLLAFIIEKICWWSLPVQERTHGFFITVGQLEFVNRFFSNINYKISHSDEPYPGDVRLVGFTEMDPLLGYCMPEQTIHEMGYETEANTVVLRSHLHTGNPIKIFITRGSTTDIALNHENWPKHLSRILEQQGVCADLYVGGVGGYSSGQELLKVIRDGQIVQPDIYISYSGANESEGSECPPAAYSHEHEYTFLERSIELSNAGVLLPNTQYVFKRLAGVTPLTLNRPECDTANGAIWLHNMQVIQGIALENKASFMGFLQPVLGSGIHTQDIEMKSWAGEVDHSRRYYPSLIKLVSRHPDFLYDMSGVFDSINDKVFVDDCHLTDTYQPFIAQKIFTLLRERKLL